MKDANELAGLAGLLGLSQRPVSLLNPRDKFVATGAAGFAEKDAPAGVEMRPPERLEKRPLRAIVQNVGADDQIEGFVKMIFTPIQLPGARPGAGALRVELGEEQGGRFQIG